MKTLDEIELAGKESLVEASKANPHRVYLVEVPRLRVFDDLTNFHMTSGVGYLLNGELFHSQEALISKQLENQAQMMAELLARGGKQ